MTRGPDELLRRQITAAQEHILAAVSGLDAPALATIVAPSGWSMASMLAHLTYDDEIFWVGAVLAGDPAAISSLCDGWSTDVSAPLEVVQRYRVVVLDSRRLLAQIDLDQPPAWWPPEEIFPMPAYESGRQVAFHLLVELLTHAGHLDMARERIDGHQHLAFE